MKTYLYIIRSGLDLKDPIKIGIANNVDQRLKDLQICNPNELVVLYKIKMNSRNHAFMVENRLHRKLNRFKIRGEWFLSRAIHKVNFKELLEREHEKPSSNDDLEMAHEANQHI